MLCEDIAETMMKMTRSYTELSQLATFEERFEYLKLPGVVASDTFGVDRVFNQMFYHSREWSIVRPQVIIRDMGCDLGIEGHEFAPGEMIIIHHMNPITMDDIRKGTRFLMDPEYLISVRVATHKAIHYGNLDQLNIRPVERTPYDTCPWKRR